MEKQPNLLTERLFLRPLNIVTTRCNNREFNLAHQECREVFLYAIRKALDKYGFHLYALCIMSNHVHYLIEPQS